MRDLPILFSRPMVHGLLREVEAPGTGKTQTRRIIKMPDATFDAVFCLEDGSWHIGDALDGPEHELPVRFRKGDRLWVREAWRADDYHSLKTIYRADMPEDALADTKGIIKWKPGIHMHRHRSRLTLEVTDVRVQCLQEISQADARAEGCDPEGVPTGDRDGNGEHVEQACYRAGYATLWNAINGAGAWDAKPWVVAVTFAVAKRNIDAVPT